MALYSSCFWCVFLVCHVCAVAQMPNYYCRYAYQKLECFEDVRLEIPTNFDASQIPDDVKMISLDCPGSEHNIFCNVMKKTAPAFPARSQLSSAYFKGFKAEDGGRFPANVLLANVKGQIVILDIQNSFISKLDADYFHGFSALKTLTLADNDLSEIAPNTFEALAAKPPVLDTVSIVHCKLSSLDWAVWEPVADSLTEINLASQKPGLETLTRSGPTFFLNSLKRLALIDNKLSTIPKEVLETINYNVMNVQVQCNNFCPSAHMNCYECAELTDFFRWICDLKKPATENVNSIIQYTCGSGAAARDSLLSMDRYSYNYFTSAASSANSFMFVEAAQFNPNCTVHISSPEPAVQTGTSFCAKAEPIKIACTGTGNWTTTATDIRRTDATSFVISIDNSLRCRDAFYEIHVKTLQMAEKTDQNQSVPGTVTADCREGNLTVDVEDADATSVTILTLESDLTLRCRNKFLDLLNFIYAQTFVRKSITSTSYSSALIPINQWKDGFLVCSQSQPLILNCTRTGVSFSENAVLMTKATSLFFRSDDSFRCRIMANAMHKRLLRQKGTVITSQNASRISTDALVAVCQKGRVVLSDGNPELSVFKDIEYYSAPNKLCRDMFLGFLKFVAELVQNPSPEPKHASKDPVRTTEAYPRSRMTTIFSN